MVNQEQAVKDLLGVFVGHVTPEGVKEHLSALSRAVQLLGRADDGPGEDACIEAIQSTCGWTIIGPFFRQAIRELCHYVPEEREQIINAALREARATAKESTRLGKMEKRYAGALDALDPKSKAVLRIVSELNDASGNTTAADFLNIWWRRACDWPVDVLRDDPAYADLVELFDLAELLNEANG